MPSITAAAEPAPKRPVLSVISRCLAAGALLWSLVWLVITFERSSDGCTFADNIGLASTIALGTVLAAMILGALAGHRRTFLQAVLSILVVLLLLLFLPARSLDCRQGAAFKESQAIRSVRAITGAQTEYARAHPRTGFACSMADLAAGAENPSGTNPATSPELASGAAAGYRFTITCRGVAPHAAYDVTAEPLEYRKSGLRAICADQSGILRYDIGGSGVNCLKEGTVLQ